MKKKLTAALALALCLTLTGCGAAGEWGGYAPDSTMGEGGFADLQQGGNYSYNSVIEAEFKETSAAPSSYFSLDRNTANYAQVRSQLNAGRKIAGDSVRIEELVNYFDYAYPAPEEGEIAVSSYLSDCPWAEGHKIATFGIRTQEAKLDAACNNYTFLIDISGSMAARVCDGLTALDLVKEGIYTLVGGLGGNDRVSIVVYASGVGVKLEPTLATEEGKKEILRVVEDLRADGSTNGEGGLQLAYRCAEKYYAEDGNNRVILLSDGDFNVGMSSVDSLKRLISEKAETGVFLTVVGVGMGNMRDDIMETLALAGNGNYAYLDTPLEAKKVFGSELAGTLFTVAKDAKAGVTFDPAAVASYRILGYDMKLMSEEDFNDPGKDAGELGSNLTVTVMYELVPTERFTGTAATAEIRYKSVDGIDKTVSSALSCENSGGDDQAFAACVAEFGLVLRNSEYRGKASLDAVLSRLDALGDYVSGDEFRAEFRGLVARAKQQ